jgi:hypothetical protein
MYTHKKPHVAFCLSLCLPLPLSVSLSATVKICLSPFFPPSLPFFLALPPPNFPHSLSRLNRQVSQLSLYHNSGPNYHHHHGGGGGGQEQTTDHRMVFGPERPGTDWRREGDRASTNSSTNSCANWRKGDRSKMQHLSLQEFRLWALEAWLLALRQSAGWCSVFMYG